MELICDRELLSHGKVNNESPAIAVDEFKRGSCVDSSLNLDSEENEPKPFKPKFVESHNALENEIHNENDGKTLCNNISNRLLLDHKENDSALNSARTQSDSIKKDKKNQNSEFKTGRHKSFMRNRRENKLHGYKNSANRVKILSDIQKGDTKKVEKIPTMENNDETYELKTQSSNRKMKTKRLERIPVIKNSDGMFKCEKCSKIFSCRRYLKKHHLTHFPIPEDQKPFKCPKCSRSFARERNLKNHSCINNNLDSEETYACEECGKTFQRQINLRKHRRTHSDKMNHTCVVCGKGFIRKSDYTSHCLTHSDKKPFECDVCKKSFTRKSHLVGHCRTHATEKPFVCGVCNKRFLLERYLNDHSFIHTDEKPFVCDKCNKGFARRSQFNEHYITHTDIKPFNCDECGEGFGLKRLLQTHQLTHLKEKPFSCDLCEKRFTRKGNLSSHQLLHLKERPFSCNVCEKRFSRKSNLNSHQLLHLGNGYGQRKQKNASTNRGFDWNYDSINMSTKGSLDSSLRCSRENQTTDSSGDDSYICDVMKTPKEVYFSLNPFFAKKDGTDVTSSVNS